MEDTLSQVKSQPRTACRRRGSACNPASIDAETQFRTEQNKLTDLQDQLDRLDKLLDSLSRKQP